MTEITRNTLRAYLDDALTDAETARVEHALRDSEKMRDELRLVMQERDRGDHSVGAVWRRARITCPSREQLGSYLLEALDPEFQDYIKFHLENVACPFCLANLTDLQSLQKEVAPQVETRRRRYFHSSAGLLPK